MKVKTLIMILTIILALWFFPSAGGISAPTAMMKVFIFAGQSNMVGDGRTAELPKDMSDEQKNVFVFSESRWKRYTPHGSFGPELSFVLEMAKFWPQERIGIIKLAKGGTSLLDWAPDWTEEKAKVTGGNWSALYKKLMKQVKLAREKDGFDVVGMIWMQGARDAKFKEAADVYAVNFENFIASVRKDTGKPELPFLFGRSNPPEKGYRHIAAVQKAQAAVAEKVPKTVMIETEGLSKKEDRTHFDTNGQLELGRRFAAAYINLVEKTVNKK